MATFSLVASAWISTTIVFTPGGTFFSTRSTA